MKRKVQKKRTPDINTILLKDPAPCKWGAPMGATNFIECDDPLYLQKLRFNSGDYAADGTYWGGGEGTAPLWCAFNDGSGDYLPGYGTRIYVRAFTRDEALWKIAHRYNQVKFHRGPTTHK